MGEAAGTAEGSDSKTAGLGAPRFLRRDSGLGVISCSLFLGPSKVPAEGGAFSSSRRLSLG